MRYRSRSAQGSQMASEYQPAVTVGGAGPDFVLLNDANLFAGFYQIVGTGQPDNPAADDKNVSVSAHF